MTRARSTAAQTGRHRFVRLLLAVVIVTVLGACGEDGDEQQPAAQSPGSSERAGFGDGDVAFVLEGGTLLTSLLTTAQLAASASPEAEVQALAQQIADRTGPRVDAVARWVRTWGEQGAELGHDAAPHGPVEQGFSVEVVNRLQQASGERFDRIFLPALAEHLRATRELMRRQAVDGTHEAAVSLAEDTAADAARWLGEVRRLEGDAR